MSRKRKNKVVIFCYVQQQKRQHNTKNNQITWIAATKWLCTSADSQVRTQHFKPIYNRCFVSQSKWFLFIICNMNDKKLMIFTFKQYFHFITGLILMLVLDFRFDESIAKNRVISSCWFLFLINFIWITFFKSRPNSQIWDHTLFLYCTQFFSINPSS